MKKIIISVGIFIMFFAPVVNGDSFRCGNRIVTTGDSKIEIIGKCGQPDDSETVSYDTKGFSFRTGSIDVSTRKVEKIYYNCGSGRFIRILTLIDGKLVSIEEGGYGSGPQKCN